MQLRIRLALALALPVVAVQAAAGDAGCQAWAASHPAPGAARVRQSVEGQRPQPGRPVVVRVDRGGFRWGDAAIGAAGAVGIVLLVGGLVLVVAGAKRDRGRSPKPKT